MNPLHGCGHPVLPLSGQCHCWDVEIETQALREGFRGFCSAIMELGELGTPKPDLVWFLWHFWDT